MSGKPGAVEAADAKLTEAATALAFKAANADVAEAKAAGFLASQVDELTAAALESFEARMYSGISGSPTTHAFSRPADPVGGDRRAPRYAATDDVMAIVPSALERAYMPSFFDDEEEAKEYDIEDGVAIIAVDGPLMQRGGWWWDGYDCIQDRFEDALEDSDVTAVVLKIASPGGVCSGCFSAVRAMLSAKAESGKPVYAYADESAFSAAYAIACVADEIYLPREGGVGSVGVIGVLQDWTGYNEKMGIRVAVVTSGKYKAEGHPDVALKPDVIARYQARIDMLAQSFAEVVATSRGLTSEAVLGLQAACFFGADAITAGLANGIKTFDEVMTMARSKGLASISTNSPAHASASTRTHMTIKGDTTQAIEGSFSHAEFALAAGLPHDASKGDVLAAMSRTRTEHESLVAACGAKTTAEAIGKASAMPAIVKDAEEAKSALAVVRKEQETASVGGLIEKANAAGKFGEAGTEKAFALYTKHGKDALEAHLDALIPQKALVAKTVTQLESKGDKPAGAKAEIVVELSAVDEKNIKTYGLDRAAFIADRRTELEAKAARAADLT